MFLSYKESLGKKRAKKGKKGIINDCEELFTGSENITHIKTELNE
jgi:hypothetical protein